MKQILNKLNELISICGTRVKKADEQRERNQSVSSQLDAKAKELDALAKKIAQDKAALDALKVKHDVLAHAGKLKKELTEEIKRQKGITAEIEKGKKEVEKMKEEAMSEIKARTEKLNKASLQLEDDKKKYKDDVMSSISKELKKKGIEL